MNENDQTDELTAAQIAELRTRLILAQAEAQATLESSAEGAKPVDLELSIGRLSRVDAMQQQQLAVARRRRVLAALQQVQRALSRLDDGLYGACLNCEEPIGFARLALRPEASRCRRCAV